MLSPVHHRVVACLAFVISSATVVAQDAWPQFRGPGGQGIAVDKKLGPVEFGPGKNEVWKIAMPAGLSSPCVWGERIFLTSCDSAAKKLETHCIARADGRTLWRHAVSVDDFEDVHKTSNPASATPACDGERVFVYFASYGLIAYSLDGETKWEAKLPVPEIMFGSGTSPALVGDLVVLNRTKSPFFRGPLAKSKKLKESAASEIVAFDRKSGAIAWRTPMMLSPMGRSHATPVVANGRLLVLAGGRVSALDPATGKAVWWFDQMPAVATASPLVFGDRLFLNCTGVFGDVDRVPPPTFEEALATWDANKDGKLQRDEIPKEFAIYTRHRADHQGDFDVRTFFFQRADTNRDGALSKDEWDQMYKQVGENMNEFLKPMLVALTLGGEGNVGDKNKVWSTSKGVPEVPSMVGVGSNVYAVRNGGLVTCFDAADGKVHFEERLGASGSYYASPITDGTHVYFISQPGVVTVIRASDKFERLARVDLKEEIGATPALVGGKLYVRTAGHLYAFGP